MAVVPFTDAFLSANDHDLTGFAKNVTLNYSAEMLDKTVFGATSRAKIGGLKTWSLDVTFNLDFASSSGPDTVLWGLVGTSACYEFRPFNVCGSNCNPIYSGIGCLENWPLGGAVGALLEVKCTIQGAGDLARATAS